MLVLNFFNLLYVAILNWCFLTSYFTKAIDFYKLISFTGTSLNLFVYSNCSGIGFWAKIAVLYHIRKVFMHFYFECMLFKIKNDCWILTNFYFRIYGGFYLCVSIMTFISTSLCSVSMNPSSSKKSHYFT